MNYRMNALLSILIGVGNEFGSRHVLTFGQFTSRQMNF